MATSTLGLNQFTKGGQTSLLNSYNADMLKIDNGIAADRARLTAAEQAIAALPSGYDLDMLIPIEFYDSSTSGWTYINSGFCFQNIKANTKYKGKFIFVDYYKQYASYANLKTKARADQTGKCYVQDVTDNVYLVNFVRLEAPADQYIADANGCPSGYALTDEFEFTTRPNSEKHTYSMAYYDANTSIKWLGLFTVRPNNCGIFLSLKEA